jgi:hypothetical protein
MLGPVVTPVGARLLLVFGSASSNPEMIFRGHKSCFSFIMSVGIIVSDGVHIVNLVGKSHRHGYQVDAVAVASASARR